MTEKSSESESDSISVTGVLLAIVTLCAICLFPPMGALTPPAQRLIAVTAAMAVLWFGQCIPVAVTSLLPMFLYPLLGIATADQVCAPYANKNVFLFLGGFLIALGLEQSGLHRRLALHLVSRVGSSPRAIVFGFMFTTALLSMWISNTASTMLMVPIALALLKTLQESGEPGEFDEIMRRLVPPTLLGIAYGASTGGFSTLIGTPTNVTFRGYWDEHFVSKGAEMISSAEWMLTFIPVSALMLVFVGLFLTWPLRGRSRLAELSRDFFQERLQALGPMRRSEKIVAAVFMATAVLWTFRVPLKFDNWELLPGWTNLLANAGTRLGIDLSFMPKYVDDASIAMGMGTLLFFLPGDPKPYSTAYVPLIKWSQARTHIPWGMLLLIGSGFAIAEAFDLTKLSDWLGSLIASSLQGQSPIILVAGICLFVTFLTEFTTNVATLNMLLPVLAGVAADLKISPLLILLPATISASCAYMLPVGTPPNAIVFGTGKVSMRQMASAGFVLNLIGVVVITLALTFWAPLTMSLDRDVVIPDEPANAVIDESAQ